MSRIIAGTAGGRRLHAPPPGSDTRPTSERVREGLFASLEHDPGLSGAEVLDLYAGVGGLGLECASRGAASVVLVESRRTIAALARRNARELGLAQVQVVIAEVERYLSGTAPGPGFGLILADPPYPMDDQRLAAVLARITAGGWAAPGATLVVERSRRSPEPVWPVGVTGHRSRRYGDTVLWFARSGHEPDESPPQPQVQA